MIMQALPPTPDNTASPDRHHAVPVSPARHADLRGIGNLDVYPLRPAERGDL